MGILLLVSLSAVAVAQETIPLYPDQIPNSIAGPDQETRETENGILKISNVSKPELTIYRATGDTIFPVAVIICPGGGYKILASGHEGADVAEALSQQGITAAVLKYRLPDDAIMPDKSIGPLQDAQRAIQYLREHAQQYGIDPDKIGIMGFSAGGHLAALAGTRYRKALIPNKKRTSLRPDFMALIYPVISFSSSITHSGSRDNLLGKEVSSRKLAQFSPDELVNAKTPPTFLVHAKDDQAVPIENSNRFYQRLREEDIATAFYQYNEGGHGFGLINPTSSVRWLDVFTQWLRDNRFR